MSFDPSKAARFIDEAHRSKARYENLPAELAPRTISEAYDVQEALRDLWIPVHGAVAGLKIATTTKVMQQLMGIDHPCAGIIYANHVHLSPARISKESFQNLAIECELAIRLGHNQAQTTAPFTRDTVKQVIAAAMPAFELIEDRHAVYRETEALSLIADNAWNGGIIIGRDAAVPDGDLDKLPGRLLINGQEVRAGKTDDPLGALAWIANLAAERDRPITAGMIVITGSVIATLPVATGDKLVFVLEGLGTTELTLV
jgi:2-keto-4-pentenoate hydratase